jgi:signal transduction histidine kinase
VIKDYTEKIKSDNKNIELLYEQQNINCPISIEADKGRINQVFSNLLNNALKFTDEGQITIGIYENSDNKNKKEVAVKVVDAGSGIDNEIYPKIFSKFATKSHQGTGLGLFISKSIIEAHEGKIWAKNNDNVENKGATFIFTLPIIDSTLDDNQK